MSKGTRYSMDFVVPIEKLARVLGANRFVKVKGKFIRVDVQGVDTSHVEDIENDAESLGEMFKRKVIAKKTKYEAVFR